MSGSKTNLAQVWLHIYLFHAGTLFLWLYWPSFNSALASGNAQNRAIINTYYSMTGSVVSTFIFSSVFDSHRKLNMVWDRLSVDLERKKYIKVVFFWHAHSHIFRMRHWQEEWQWDQLPTWWSNRGEHCSLDFWLVSSLSLGITTLP